MKIIKINPRARHEGSVLLAVLSTTIIVAILLVGVLNLGSHQNLSVMRNHCWNTAIPVAEAGIEEAFTHLNKDAGNMTTNGWVSQTEHGTGLTVYTKRRDFANDGSYCLVKISSTSPPTVTSQGYVPAPLRKGFLVRTVRVTTQLKSSSAPGGITVKHMIDLGSDFLIDSYDSTDPTASTNGKYDPAKARANGNLASISTDPDQIKLADSKVFGHVYTPPTGNYFGLGTHGMVGDQAYQSNVAHESSVQPGYYSNDLNTTVPDVAPPAGYTTFPTPAAGQMNKTVGGVLYAYVLGTGNYQLPAGTTLKGKVLIQGDVTLYIPSTGRIQFGSGDLINLSSVSNASLKMYNASTKDVVMKDISNDSAIPSRFTYYGLPTTAGSKLTMTGSGAYAFAGLINAPNQDIVLTGSSGGNQDFLGAIIANNFTMSGHTYMHIDESLLQGGGGSSIPVISSYAEISPIDFP